MQQEVGYPKSWLAKWFSPLMQNIFKDNACAFLISGVPVLNIKQWWIHKLFLILFKARL